MKIDFRKMAKIAALAADEKKAVHTRVLDLRNASDVADYMVIAGAESSAQINAIDESIEQALKAEGLRILRREGRGKDRWRVLDYGGIVLHVLLQEAREFFRLEQMWEDAKAVVWEKEAKPAKPVKRSVPKRAASKKKKK